MRTLNIILILLLITSSSCIRMVYGIYKRHEYKRDYLPAAALTENDFYVEVPYKIHDGKIFVKVKLDKTNKEYDFMVDTGARSFLSNATAAEIGAVPIATKETHDIHGAVEQALLYKVDLSLGEFKVVDLGILSKDLTVLSNGCYVLDGILGHNILNEAVFHFDVERKLLVITNSIKNIPQHDSSTRLKLKKHWSGHSFVSLEVHQRKANFLFDTGSSNFLFIEPRLLEKEIPLKQRMQYLGGLHSAKPAIISIYAAQNITLGGHHIISPETAFALSVPNQKIGNNLGSEIFQYYYITLDRRHQKIYFAPAHPIQKDSTSFRISNLQLDWENERVFVSALTLNSNLQKLGLELNDTVIAINGISTNVFGDYCSFKAMCDTTLLQSITVLKKEKEIDYILTEELVYDN